MGGAAAHAATASRGNMAGMRSDVSGGRFAQHEMGEMRMAHDHDHDHDRDRDGGRDRDRDRDRHDHDRFRVFPSFAYDINSYADTYDPNYGDCWELHRAWTRTGWRVRRMWVCN
jgi:hypothetical protein